MSATYAECVLLFMCMTQRLYVINRCPADIFRHVSDSRMLQSQQKYNNNINNNNKSYRFPCMRAII